MALTLTDELAELVDDVSADDAQGLSDWLRAQPGRTVRLDGCAHLHAAVLQVLLALKPAISGEPADPRLRAALGLSDTP